MQIIHDPSAERSLINCGFYNPQEMDLLDVHPYHFRNIEHQKIWEAMARQDTPDVVTVSAASGVPAHKINDILLDDVVYWNAKEYAEIVKKEYAGRIGAEIGSRIVTDAHNGEDVRERVASYIRDLDKLTTVSGAGRKLVDIISDAVDDVLERVALIAKGEKVEVGYQTGISWIDEAFGGMKRGWLVIDAGQPGVGAQDERPPVLRRLP